MSRARRAASGLLGAAFALAASAACGSREASPPGGPLASRGPGVQRLGLFGGYARFGGVARAVLRAEPAARLRIPIRELPASLLDLAAGIVPPAPAGRGPDSAAGCAARLIPEPRDEPALELARFEPPAGPMSEPRWSEARVEVPPLRRGWLELACEGGSRATWARPLATPLVPGSHPPLIVLMSLDTLRADFVGGFGGRPGLTPNLAALGDEGLRVLSATSEGTWTLPSHFALFYSRMFGYPVEERRLVPLAGALAERGFVTLGLTGGGFMGSRWKFHRGFDAYVEYGTYTDKLPRVLADALDRVRRFAGVPTFLYVHSYAVHRQTPPEMEWQASHGFERRFEPDAAQVEAARALYADLVSRTDADLGPFFSALAGIAESRPTLLVIVSDHGEAFGEHGGFRHGSGGAPRVTLHDEVIRVPIVVWGPGSVPPGRQLSRAVMLSDVAPSILAAAGIPAPPSMRGTDLWPEWSQTGRSAPRAGGVSQSRDAWSLRQPDRKLIATRRDDALHFELYDLSGDPLEREDLAPSRPEEVRGLREELHRQLERAGAESSESFEGFAVCAFCDVGRNDGFWRQVLGGEPGTAAGRGLDAETRRRLRELGYAGSAQEP